MRVILAFAFLGTTLSIYVPQTPSQILVSFSAENAVGMIDPNSASVARTIAVATNPHEIALSRDRKRAYVATTGGPPNTVVENNVVSALDLDAGAALQNVRLESCATPHDVRVSQDGATIWVACGRSNSVAEVNVASGNMTHWKTGAEGGWFVAVTPDDGKLYVPHLEGKRVTAIDRGRRTVTTVLEGGAQSGIDISPDGKAVWVVDHERGRIHIIDPATDAVVAQVPLDDNAFGRIRFTPDSSRVLLVQDKMLRIIDAATRRVTGVIGLPYAGKVVDVSPAGDRAAVSHPEDNKVSIIDLPSRKVAATINVGKAPDGVAWIR